VVFNKLEDDSSVVGTGRAFAASCYFFNRYLETLSLPDIGRPCIVGV